MLRRTLVLIVPLLLGATCEAPRDPHKTLERVRGGVLMVGVAEAPPVLEKRGEDASGVEAETIRGFARSLGARVQWNWGAQEKQLGDLHEFRLDLVAGGIGSKTPWSAKVAITRPYLESGGEKYVLAAPPGENAFLEQLERYLAAHHDDIARRAGETR